MDTADRERHTTRPFAAGAFGFAVATADDADRSVVESLFRDLPAPGSSERPIGAFSILRIGPNDERSLSGPHLGSRSVSTLATGLKLLVNAVNRCALDAEPEHLHLHAAAATNEGRAVVIAAQRGVGKTTTVAHLAARGWGFITDETVRLSAEKLDVTGFPKPLSIKPGSDGLVAHLEPWMIPAGADGAESFRFVPMGASGARLACAGDPHLVVLLRRPADDSAVTGPVTLWIHPADAVVALMQETLDAERFGTAAMKLAALAAASHCYDVTIGTPTETANAIEALFRLDPVGHVKVSALPLSDSFSAGVVSVAVGDRTVVHDMSSGRIFALDPVATRVWSQLGGWSVDEEIDVDGPVIGPLVAQLRALGVLAGAA